MEEITNTNRRRFLQTIAGAALSQTLHLPLCGALTRAGDRTARFAYVGAYDGIWVYSITGDGSFSRLQTIASANPAAMAIRNWNLYVVNCISAFAGLPRGTAESYGINAESGMLEFKNRVPLSLSAVDPRSIAVCPDGSAIVVGVHGGGAYNVLPIQADGSLGRVAGILKETGSGPHWSQTSSHPAAVLFDSAGRLLSVDQGTDNLNVFAVRKHDMSGICRHNVASGSGPTSIALHPKGDRFYVAQAFRPSISSFKYDTRSGKIVDHLQMVHRSLGDGSALLAIHPSGEALYSSHGRGIQGWKVAGKSLMRSSSGIEEIKPTALCVTNDGKDLFAVTSEAVLRIRIDASTKMPVATAEATSVVGALSIATL